MNVLMDACVWIGHFRERNEALIELLNQDRVLVHPMITGELACGTPPDRVRSLVNLSSLRCSQQPSYTKVLNFLEQH
jgi:predicted nucleic acid-binding protein